MTHESIRSYYDVSSVPFGSNGFKEHQRLVFDEYRSRGFLDEAITRPEDLRDEHDDEHTRYHLLSVHDTKELGGTLRILTAKNGMLPVLRAYPQLAVAGVVHRFCETTRVISLKRYGLLGRRSIEKQVLFEAVIRSLAYAKRNGLWGMVSLGSPSIFEWINASFCGTQHGIGPPFPYQGGIVIPSLIWVDEFERTLERDAMPLYEYYQRALA